MGRWTLQVQVQTVGPSLTSFHPWKSAFLQGAGTQALNDRLGWHYPLTAGAGTANHGAIVVMTGDLQCPGATSCWWVVDGQVGAGEPFLTAWPSDACVWRPQTKLLSPSCRGAEPRTPKPHPHLLAHPCWHGAGRGLGTPLVGVGFTFSLGTDQLGRVGNSRPQSLSVRLKPTSLPPGQLSLDAIVPPFSSPQH